MNEETREDTPLQAKPQRQEAALEPAPEAAWSLEEVFELHHKRVLNAAYRITGQAADAEDVLQTVFLRLARREVALGPAEELGAYLHRAGVNAALDLIRGRKRARAVPLEEAEGHCDEDAQPGPERQRQRRETREALREGLATLTQRAAEIFVLRYVEGYGNKEIAHMLGTSQTAIGVTLHRVRGQLRGVLDTPGGALS